MGSFKGRSGYSVILQHLTGSTTLMIEVRFSCGPLLRMQACEFELPCGLRRRMIYSGRGAEMEGDAWMMHGLCMALFCFYFFQNGSGPYCNILTEMESHATSSLASIPEVPSSSVTVIPLAIDVTRALHTSE